MKKLLFIFVLVMTAPILFVSVAAFAAGAWRDIGTTAAGDQVSVSSVSSKKSGLRTAWIRVQYKEPTKLPQGGPFVELRARVRFNCPAKSALTNYVWLYAREHGELVVSRKVRRDDQFGLASEGNFGELARTAVCK